MKNNIRKSVVHMFSCLALFAAYLYAAPVISVDSQHVNLGSIREGTVKRVRHVFKIFNKGNEPLIISRVKAS